MWQGLGQDPCSILELWGVHENREWGPQPHLKAKKAAKQGTQVSLKSNRVSLSVSYQCLPSQLLPLLIKEMLYNRIAVIDDIMLSL